MVDNIYHYTKDGIARAFIGLGMTWPVDPPQATIPRLKEFLATALPRRQRFIDFVCGLEGYDPNGVYLRMVAMALKGIADQVSDPKSQATEAIDRFGVGGNNPPRSRGYRGALHAVGEGLAAVLSCVDRIGTFHSFVNNLDHEVPEVFANFSAAEVAQIERITRNSEYLPRFENYLDIILKIYADRPTEIRHVDPDFLGFALEALTDDRLFERDHRYASHRADNPAQTLYGKLSKAFETSPVHTAVLDHRRTVKVGLGNQMTNLKRPFPPRRDIEQHLKA